MVAHPDDELLFINPHLETDIQAGKRVETVYTTSGDSTLTMAAWMARETSVMTAHAAMAAVTDAWTCTTTTSYAGKNPRRCVLTAHPLVTSIFLRIRDGSVRDLLSGATVNTADSSTTYTQAQLLATLAAIQAEINPGRVGTLDGTLAHGPDHNDHVATGILTFDASRADGVARQLIMYRGYTIFPPTFQPPPPQAEPANLSTAERAEKVRITEIYDMGPLDSDYDAWCSRLYPIPSLTAGPGQIHSAEGPCLEASAATDGAVVTAATCAAGAMQTWTVSGNSRVLGPGGRCLGIGANGTSIVIEPCTGGADQWWTLLSDGQLHGASDTCLTRSGTSVTSTTCDVDTSQAYYFPPASQHWSP